ncbi:MAG: hypothetical protein HQL15_09025, partial [Candidatus Omnitrophica bacterium]|nr:hypothetical protein [Candidatus Omnitrophota bacterium]
GRVWNTQIEVQENPSEYAIVSGARSDWKTNSAPKIVISNRVWRELSPIQKAFLHGHETGHIVLEAGLREADFVQEKAGRQMHEDLVPQAFEALQRNEIGADQLGSLAVRLLYKRNPHLLGEGKTEQDYLQDASKIFQILSDLKMPSGDLYFGKEVIYHPKDQERVASICSSGDISLEESIRRFYKFRQNEGLGGKLVENDYIIFAGKKFKDLLLASILENTISPGGVLENSIDEPQQQKKKELGGIDFNSEKMNLETRNQGGEIKFNLDSAQLAQLQNAPGFTPVIINIQPITDLPMFLGISEKTGNSLTVG